MIEKGTEATVTGRKTSKPAIWENTPTKGG